MNFFTISTTEQALTIDKLKNCGCEVIQVSNGLVIKTDKSLNDIQSEIGDSIVKELDKTDPDLSKDTKVFAGIE